MQGLVGCETCFKGFLGVPQAGQDQKTIQLQTQMMMQLSPKQGPQQIINRSLLFFFLYFGCKYLYQVSLIGVTAMEQ